MIKLDSSIIYGFVRSCLVKDFDGSLDTPQFHHELWDLFCSKNTYVAVAAPRSHAKSTAGTISYGLAALLFRNRRHLLIVSNTEEQASAFLQEMRSIMVDNEQVKALFKLTLDDKGETKFITDSVTELVGSFQDGEEFRILAKGSGQRLRGMLWKGTRPDLILCHEKGTEIYTPETGWIKNQDYPDSKTYKTQDAFRVEFEDGTAEVVTGDHRYLTSEGWKNPWMMKNGDNVVENITDDTMNYILNEEKRLSKNITLKQKLKNASVLGLQIILIRMLLLKETGTSKIGSWLTAKLRNIACKILASPQSTVQNVVVGN